MERGRGERSAVQELQAQFGVPVGTFQAVQHKAAQMLLDTEGAQVDHLLGAPMPNPFTERTSLVLQTATAQHVRASLYTTLGQRVQTLLDRPLAAGSAHVLAVSANGLAAGLYILHVEGETFSETRELVVAR